jgi:hypothetical protein
LFGPNNVYPSNACPQRVHGRAKKKINMKTV